MKNTKKPGNDPEMTVRFSFTEAEKINPWLSMLLDAYFMADKGIIAAIRQEEKQGRKLVCEKKCSSCCRTHKTVPVYPLELLGMSWYATEMVHGSEREKLKYQFRDREESGACQFLVDDICSVHSMRPLACRYFNVFDQTCEEGEDAYYSRRQDVLTPIRKYMDQAISTMLPFYGIKKKSKQQKAIETNAIHELAKVLQSIDLSGLAAKMDSYDKNTAG